MEPRDGFEPSTPALRKLCSTVELSGRRESRTPFRQGIGNSGRILIAVTVESSRKTDAHAPFGPGGCPRCGTRLGEPYKYCPNCAYRLRPDLFPAPAKETPGVPRSQRLVALGGY